MKLKYFIPLAVFAALVVLFLATLDRDTRLVPSPLVGKPAPDFSLKSLKNPKQVVSNKSLIGKPWVLNVWASWCRECRIEHPLFNQLAANHDVTIIGLNYKDTRNDALNWLARLGDPYDATAFDLKGVAGLEWGVYGVPETFVIDAEGIIQMKHIGVVNAKIINEKILPLLIVNNVVENR